MGNHVLIRWLQEAGIVYRLHLSNQQIIWLRIFLVHASPQALEGLPATAALICAAHCVDSRKVLH